MKRKHIVVDERTHRDLVRIAKENRRSLGAQVAVIVEQYKKTLDSRKSAAAT